MTYSRCQINSREEVLEKLKLVLVRPIKRYLIGYEKHTLPALMPAGGLGAVNLSDHHFHCYIELETPLFTRNQFFADLGSEHGKYEAARDIKKVVIYCTKEDKEPLSDWDWKSFLAGKPQRPNKRAEIGELIVNNRLSLPELLPTHPELIFGYKRLKHDIQEYTNDLYQVNGTRQVTAYWYHGPTRLGKSWKAQIDTGHVSVVYDRITRIPHLRGDFGPFYFKDSHCRWFDGYSGQPILFIDELPLEGASWNANYIKKWTDCIPLRMEIKGTTVWAQWSTVIVTCQHSIQDYYQHLNKIDLDAILARFRQIHITIKQF